MVRVLPVHEPIYWHLGAIQSGFSPYDEDRKELHLQQEKKKQAEAEAAGNKSNFSPVRGLNLFLHAKKEAGKSKSAARTLTDNNMILLKQKLHD